VSQTISINEIYGLGPIVAFLGYISTLVALLNLAPSRELDGLEAWKLIPVLTKKHIACKNSEKMKSYKVVK
jgi:hypothetical protein